TLWTFKSEMEGVGGANGAPAIFVVNGREYLVMAFGGTRSRNGDALIGVGLPQGGAGAGAGGNGSGRPVPLGTWSDSALQPPLDAAPPGTHVIELVTHDFSFLPESFTALAGEKIAVHIVNTGSSASGFTITLPTGRIGMKGTIAANKDGYFTFTAPEQP